MFHFAKSMKKKGKNKNMIIDGCCLVLNKWITYVLERIKIYLPYCIIKRYALIKINLFKKTKSFNILEHSFKIQKSGSNGTTQIWTKSIN